MENYFTPRDENDIILRNPIEKKEYAKLEALYRQGSEKELFELWRDKSLPMALVDKVNLDSDAEVDSIQTFWFGKDVRFLEQIERPIFFKLNAQRIDPHHIQKGKMRFRGIFPSTDIDDNSDVIAEQSIDEFYVREKVTMEMLSIEVDHTFKKRMAFYKKIALLTQEYLNEIVDENFRFYEGREHCDEENKRFVF